MASSALKNNLRDDVLKHFPPMEFKLFSTSLIFSFLIHAAVIGILSLPSSQGLLFSKSSKTIEVTYQNLKQLKVENKEIVVKDFKIAKRARPQEKQKVEVLTKNENMFSVFGSRIRDISKMSGNLLTNQKKNPKITTLDIGRKITLPPMGTTKITNPKYITYNDDMRATISRNIKQRAYTYVNHSDFEAGQVYLTFVLASDGVLKQLKIIDEKTSANDYLRSVALRSVRESSPFPPFPIGFDYPEFTFNLMISFQD